MCVKPSVRGSELPLARLEETVALSTQTGGREAHRHSTLSEYLCGQEEETDNQCAADKAQPAALSWGKAHGPSGRLSVKECDVKQLAAREPGGSLLVDRAVLHHQLHLANRRDVAGRVALDRDQIGQVALLDLPELGGHPQHPGIDRRRRAKRCNGRHAVGDEHLDLPCIVAVGEYADVATIADRHTGVERRPKTFLLGDDRWAIGIDAFAPAAVLQDRITLRKRRNQTDAALGHHLEDFGRAVVAVFYAS